MTLFFMVCVVPWHGLLGAGFPSPCVLAWSGDRGPDSGGAYPVLQVERSVKFTKFLSLLRLCLCQRSR